jgi:hypothetical protein
MGAAYVGFEAAQQRRGVGLRQHADSAISIEGLMPALLVLELHAAPVEGHSPP